MDSHLVNEEGTIRCLLLCHQKQSEIKHSEYVSYTITTTTTVMYDF